MVTFEVLKFARYNSLISEHLNAILIALDSAELHDCKQKGMDFCKYAYIPAKDIGYKGRATIAWIKGNEAHIRSAYVYRMNDHAKELQYLDRWLDKEHVEGAPASFIAVVLYTKEQLYKEGLLIQAAYGIVAAQVEPTKQISPMTPATIERNSMGPEFGGNGTPIDRTYHDYACAFWSMWAIVR